jgi:hypothetical protein
MTILTRAALRRGGAGWLAAAAAATSIIAWEGTARGALVLGAPVVEAQGGVAVVGTPTLGLSGAGTAGDPYKISGRAEFRNDDSGPAVVKLQGTLSAKAGERITASYDMSVDWDPDFEEGLSEYIFQGSLSLDPLPSIPIHLAQGIFDIGSHQYQGSESFTIPGDIENAGLYLELYMYIGQLGNLTLDIPANSIDIALVPEPGSAGLAALALAGRRRRRAGGWERN